MIAVPTGITKALFLVLRRPKMLSRTAPVGLLVLYTGLGTSGRLENVAVVDWVPQLPPETAPKH